MKYLLFLFIVCFFAPFAWAQGPDFTVSPNPVCEGQPLNINYNNWSGYQTLDWSFCASNPEEVPDADILDVSSSFFSQPVFVALAEDSVSNKFGFVSNHSTLAAGSNITRLNFGTDILNPSPQAFIVNHGAPFTHLEGIQVVNDNDNWYGFVIGGKEPPYFSRLNFGSSLQNANPTRHNLGNPANLQYPHALYVFKDDAVNQWFGLTVNAGSSQDPGALDGSVSRFHFNQGLGNVPVGENLFGGLGIFDYPVGIYAVVDDGNWYVFVTDVFQGLIRINFGNSLTNNPSVNDIEIIGNIDGALLKPRGISLIRYCDDIYGFVVNDAGEQNSLVRLHFENGITQHPTATIINELDSFFNFPHSISDVLRSGDEMFALITNVLSNDIVRIFFPTCDDDVPAQSGPNPEPVVYNIPGTQTIELIVDLGLPTQQNICHDVVINALPTAAMNGGGDICEGETAVIEVNFTGEPPWEFTYTDGDNPQDITTSENPYTLTVSPAETTTYSITALTDNNCTGTNLGGDVIITVTPVDDATFSYSTQTLCTSSPPLSPTLADPGTTGVFSATPPGLAINPNTGVIDPSSSTINIQYTVTYTTIGNCPDTTQVSPIIVTDQPDADFFYGSGSFCRNEPVQHPEPASPTASFGTFSASPAGLEINAINGAIDPAQSEPAVYTVTNFIPAADGCPSASYSTEVEIAAIPLPSFIADTVCQGSLTTLTSTSTIPSGQIDEIIWIYNGSNIGFGSEITYDFPEDGDHKVTLRVVSTKGCADEIEQDVLVLRPPAVAPSSVTSPDEFICVGHSNPVGLEVNGGFGDMVEWFTEGCGSDEPFSTTTQPILFLDPPPVETTTYYARWYTNCNVSACDSITITVSPLPEASFEFNTVCFGAPTTFINTSIVEGGEIVEMEWRFEPGIIEITDSDTIQHVFTSSGYHDVTLYAKSEMFCWNGHTQQVYVLPAPEVDLLQQIPPEMQQLSADGDTLYVCIYNSVTLDASDPDNPDQIFDWSVGSQSDTLRIGASGIGYELQYHQVYVTDTISGCVSIADIWVEFSTAACGFGIHDPFSNASIKIYPNPANNLLYVDIKDVVGDINLEIFNIQGKTVKPAYFIQHEKLFSIDISDLQPGLYFIRFYNRDLIHSVKLFISRP